MARNTFKTMLFMAVLGMLFVTVGYFVGGTSGMFWALGFAGLLNFAMYFWSHKIALASTGAKPMEERDHQNVYSIVRSLAQRDDLPMPDLYIIDAPQPNAFATGRNPKNAAVAVTTGLLGMMNNSELEGVLAHELSHVKNRDILIASIAATVAVALTMLIRMSFWTGMGNRRDSNPLALIIATLSFILAPLAAMVIQSAISRSREFEADRTGAQMTGSPLALANALEKLDAGTGAYPMKVNDATAQLFIADPLKAFGRNRQPGGFSKMFSTHPPIHERIERLTQINQGSIER